jgi:hypothetical protein
MSSQKSDPRDQFALVRICISAQSSGGVVLRVLSSALSSASSVALVAKTGVTASVEWSPCDRGELWSVPSSRGSECVAIGMQLTACALGGLYKTPGTLCETAKVAARKNPPKSWQGTIHSQSACEPQSASGRMKSRPKWTNFPAV